MKLYDASNIDSLQWPDTAEAQQAKATFVPMLKEGVTKYVANVKTQLYLLAFDDIVLPLTLNDKEYENAYVASNYYAVPMMREQISASWARPLISVVDHLFRWMKANRVVMVNNWLFSVNLYPPLTPVQVAQIGNFLRQEFADHIIMFRNVNEGAVKEGLAAGNFQVMGTRHVWLYDPKVPINYRMRRHQNKDLKLFEKHPYTVITEAEMTPSDAARLVELYAQVYIDKYTPYSPHYTQAYLEKALTEGWLHFLALRKEGKIDGVAGYHIKGDMMGVPFFGFEKASPIARDLYRMLNVLTIKEAEKRGLVLHMSSGAGETKKCRGMRSHPEYTGLSVSSLPFHRKAFWGGVGWAMGRLVFPRLTAE